MLSNGLWESSFECLDKGQVVLKTSNNWFVISDLPPLTCLLLLFKGFYDVILACLRPVEGKLYCKKVKAYQIKR